MKLYIGGAYQGQDRLAEEENPGAYIINNFHEKVRNAQDAAEYAREICASYPDCVVVSDEVGSGVVPMDHADRLWREKTGRALCIIAQNSESVTRVVCGIGVRIK